ncbi:P-loop NTPase fold protein [Actinoplanes sp. NPDC051861]|uniref:P-loop NTPase fold protein n=1 Tax=Actinoplanes sp. NPDC051861 TaxID=3155170 RepID=UPI00341A2736
MAQAAGPAVDWRRRVEIVLGDLFASGAPILVAPRSITGAMSAEVRNQVARLGARPRDDVTHSPPGQVVAVRAGGRTVLFATVVGTGSAGGGSTAGIVREAARKIGRFASAPDAVVAVPLLGAGAGGLPPEQSMRAIVDGFEETAHPTAALRIHVLSQDLADLLNPLLTALEPEPGKVGAAAAYSEAIERLAGRFPAGQQLTAGAVAVAVTGAAGGLEDLAEAGTTASIGDHLETVRGLWSVEHVPTLQETNLLLGLALDAPVGKRLLRAGLIDALVAEHGSAWDLLSPAGRDLAEDQPLLATALGAPAEWTATLPAPVTLLAFSPGGDRLAALAGRDVYDVGADGPPRRIGAVDGVVVSLGWSRDGILALRLDDDGAEAVRVDTGTVVGRVPGVTGGRLDSGLPAWLVRSGEIVRWWGPADRGEETILPAADAVLAVDGTGRRGLVALGSEALLVSTLTEDQPAEGTTQAATIGRFPRRKGPYALVMLDDRPGVAEVSDDNRLAVGELGMTPMAHVLTGGSPIDVMATDASGHCLAIAGRERVSVWPVALSRPVSRVVADYEADGVLGPDLLDSDRDAMALAGLIASEQLSPPLAIGLFGEWGSGKTFVLDQIIADLGKLTGSKGEGYVRELTVVRFNAWHYAETNLLASLVDQVLQKIAPRAVEEIPEVGHAARQVEQAAEEVARIDGELAKAETAVTESTARLVRQRRMAWIAGGLVLLLAIAAITVVAIGGPGPVFGAVSAAAVIFGYVAAATVHLRNARSQAAEIAETGRAGVAALGWFTARTAEESVRAVASHRQAVLDELRAARADEARLREQAEQVRRQAESDRVGTVLRQLSSLTEYREQLSLVTSTRDRFSEIDEAFVKDHRRVVIAIDDLDRCAAEKVVQVLEAVHLLFNFAMFVVVLAVDTRWLDQSLRIRYHQLLGGSGGAAPSDYLEKIIQIPVRLVPLDETLIRRMITGLTGRSPSRAPATRPDAPAALPLTQPDAPASVPPTQPDDVAPPLEDAPGAPEEPAAAEVPVSQFPRTPRRRLPAEVLHITEDEARAMSVVAPLVGTTPRTVKRFVNTYRLIKARVKDPAGFDRPRGGIGDHEVVAFLLAVNIGQPAAARELTASLRSASADGTLRTVIDRSDPAQAAVRRWLDAHPRYVEAPAHRFADWALEVSRFSFAPLKAES